MEKIKVSLIVAVYNSELFLEKLMESMINQTHSNIEIILVDDGSPDSSGVICDEYAKKDSRIKVVHKLNGGACEARNVGLDLATGEYLMIIDGDDWLELDYVEYLLKIALDTNSDMALSDNIFTTRNREQVEVDSIEIWSQEQAIANLIYPYVPIGPWNKIYKAELIKENKIAFSVPWSGEGLYFSVMAAYHSAQVGVGHKKVYNYRLNNAQSGLTDFNVTMGINALYNIKHIGECLSETTAKVDNAVNWHIWKNYNFLLRLILATNAKEQYLSEYTECLIQIRKRFLKVLFRSDVSLKERLKITYKSLFPVHAAKRSTSKAVKSLQQDKM